MAIDESVALLNEGQEQDARRQLEFGRLEAAQKQQQARVAQQNAKRLKVNITKAIDPAGQAATIAARQGYLRLWQYGQEAIEDFALSFSDFMILSGPVALGIYLTRLVFGNWQDGSGRFSWQGVSVPRIPAYTPVEGLYRTGKILWIGLISGAIWMAITFGGYIFTHPLETAKFAVYSAFGWLTGFFNSPQ